MSIILHSYKRERSALEVSGEKAATFLNNILTAELVLLPAGKMQMSCLLSPQGRILHDMLIYRVSSNCYWVEVASTQIKDLKKRITMYRLRKAININILENWQSAHLYHQDCSAFSTTEINRIKDNLNETQLVFEDSRRSELGLHIVCKKHTINLEGQSWEGIDLARWESIRIANMVPSGEIDLIPSRTLMLEANLDLFQAMVQGLIYEGGKVVGVRTNLEVEFYAKTVVVTTGTFLRGLMHVGKNTNKGGRMGDFSAEGLSGSFLEAGIELERLKTGTPPRIDSRSVDFSVMETQHGDCPTPVMSYLGRQAEHPNVAECAVIGIADKLKGQLPIGLLALKAGVTKDKKEIIDECIKMVREKVGPVAAFKIGIVVKRLPKTRSGKVLRGTVRKIADNEPYKMPATIDDPAILDEIKADLIENNILKL